MTKEKKNMKRENIFKNKNFLIILASLLLIVVIAVVLIQTDVFDSSKPGADDEEVIEVIPTDKDVTSTYGTTKQDAINAVKQAYNSDTYEFEAEVRADNKYIVTVSNEATGTKTVYLVEPSNLSYRIYTEE